MREGLMLLMLKNNKTKEENLIRMRILKKLKRKDGKKTEKNNCLIILNFHTMDVRYVDFNFILNLFFIITLFIYF